MDLKTSYCQRERKPCMRWVEEYFQDCLCNTNDEISFAFGIASLIYWGVAEIPQTVTNFKNKSGHGVSLAFLCTWIVGDIFNLGGCILEPATYKEKNNGEEADMIKLWKFTRMKNNGKEADMIMKELRAELDEGKQYEGRTFWNGNILFTRDVDFIMLCFHSK